MTDLSGSISTHNDQGQRTMVVAIGSPPPIGWNVDTSSGWSAHIVAAIITDRPDRIIIDARPRVMLGSSFFGGLLRIRDAMRSGADQRIITVVYGTKRPLLAGEMIGMGTLFTQRVQSPTEDLLRHAARPTAVCA